MTNATTMAMVARLVASGDAISKAELAAVTGLSRTTVSSTVDRLLRAEILRHNGAINSPGRGRPAERLAISPSAGAVLIADCGARVTRLAVVDLGQHVLAERTVDLDVRMGPAEFLDAIGRHLQDLAAEAGIPSGRRCMVIGLPARLDYASGTPVRPGIMPGWDGFAVAEPLKVMFDCPVIVENDVNLRALGEARTLPQDQVPLVTIKVGTGIGAGLITDDGRIHRGAAGASGEMGHLTLRSAPETSCICGGVGCLEAVASIPALLRRYAEESAKDADIPASGADLAKLIRDGDPLATVLLRESAEYVGEAVADIVHIFNPTRVVLTGVVTSASDELLARVRSNIYEHARPLATRNLQVTFSTLGERSGVAGAIVLGIEHLLAPDALVALTYKRG